MQQAFSSSQTKKTPPVEVNLLEVCRKYVSDGAQWAHQSEDINVTLLSWEQGQGVETHINNEVDVVVIAFEGVGLITVDGTGHEMSASAMLLIPKGSERSIQAVTERFSYLSLHKRRLGLWPTVRTGTGVCSEGCV